MEGWLFVSLFFALACVCTCAQDLHQAQKQCSVRAAPRWTISLTTSFSSLLLQPSESCLYTYTASHDVSIGGKKSELRMNSNVEVFCDSVVKHESTDAKKYCFYVKKTSFSTGDEDMHSFSDASMEAQKLLGGHFCFIQTEDGKIASVEYNPDERAEIVNFKKGIAAAFQANFKKTNVELEEDTQSKHYSRYRYKTVAPDHVIMHRIIDSQSVVQFGAAKLNGKSANVETVEDVEYKSGRLLSSKGTTTINVNGPVDSSDGSRFHSTEKTTLKQSTKTYDPNFGNGGVSGTGNYFLRLQSCSKKSVPFQRSGRVRQSFILSTSSLQVVLQDEAGHRFAEMSRIRRSVPSIRQALNVLKDNMSDSATSAKLKNLLILESEGGPLSGHQSAVLEVVDYLHTLNFSIKEEDLEMKALLYSFLAAEGSQYSQQILLNTIKTTTDVKEKNTATIQLAFIRKIHMDTVAQIEALITLKNDGSDPLILAYGALGASASTLELQNRIVQFLLQRMDLKGNVSTLIHYIHSLGNTKSTSADATLLQLLEHHGSGVRLAAVYALRHRTTSENVQEAFLNALRRYNQDPDFAEMVVRSLIANAESRQLTAEVVPIKVALFEEIINHARNNSELRALVSHYVSLLGTRVRTNILHSGGVRKRGTDWADTSDSLYNLVQDSDTRQSDITNYPLNKAYIWSKSFGVSQLKLDIAFGAFAGFGGDQNPTNYKVYAKGVARGYAYGHTATAVEALIFSENPPGGSVIQNKVYVSIVGKVLVDASNDIPNCKTWSFPLYSSPEYTLLSFPFKIFIYVGTLDFTISMVAKLAVSAELNGCINKCTSAEASLVPKVTIAAVVGASATLVETARGGIDLSASFEYNIIPKITATYQVPDGPFNLCLSLSHGWPNNVVSIYAYYQLRSVKMCKKWKLKYPCGFNWSNKHKWKAASAEWKLPSSSITELWNSCDSTTPQCSEA